MKKKKRKRKIYKNLFNKGNNNKYQIMPQKKGLYIFSTLNKKEQNKNNNNMIKRRM